MGCLGLPAATDTLAFFFFPRQIYRYCFPVAALPPSLNAHPWGGIAPNFGKKREKSGGFRFSSSDLRLSAQQNLTPSSVARSPGRGARSRFGNKWVLEPLNLNRQFCNFFPPPGFLFLFLFFRGGGPQLEGEVGRALLAAQVLAPSRGEGARGALVPRCRSLRREASAALEGLGGPEPVARAGRLRAPREREREGGLGPPRLGGARVRNVPGVWGGSPAVRAAGGAEGPPPGSASRGAGQTGAG